MRISIIAAIASNGVIGAGDGLPWHCPADLKFFKRMTMGSYLLMGRKTFETVGKPLPGRKTVVITRQTDYAVEGVLVAFSLDEAIELASGQKEIFIAGGAEIYALALERADRMYLTRIHQAFEGDTYFPKFEEADWELTAKLDYPADEENPCSLSFLTYLRREAKRDVSGTGL